MKNECVVNVAGVGAFCINFLFDSWAEVECFEGYAYGLGYYFGNCYVVLGVGA